MANVKIRAGPDGIHLFSRSSGVNVLIDKVSVSPASWSTAPRQLSVALTNACDLSCRYCYAPKSRARLDMERLLAWLQQFDTAGCLGVGFGGGEPTLYREFSLLCKLASKTTQLAISFTTHGHRLNEQLASELKGHVHFIRVSMDGVGTTYESLRGKDFKKLCQSLEIARSVAPFGINFVVNAATLPDLDAAVALANEFGAAEFLLLPERPTRDGLGIDENTREELRAWVIASRMAVRLAISETDADGLPTCDPLQNERGLRSYAHVDATGTLKRSSFDSVGVPIGPAGILDALRDLQRITGEYDEDLA
jgi:MoaA/NifB/PqqE/SkfB family radical SAM enzyme